MDFLNRAQAQIADLFKSMTPAARLTAGLLVAAVVVGLGLLVRGQLAAPDALLFGGQAFATGEIPGMEAAFAKAGLSGYQLEGARIRIPRGQQAAYVAALADGNALPANISDILDEPQKSGSMFESEKQRQQRIVTAKQKALSLVLSSMQGIETATVMYDVQVESSLARKKVATASVSVKPEGGQPLDEGRVAAIRHLVAGAIAGLAPESVAVTDLNSNRFYPPGDASPGGAGPGSDAYIERKRRYEQEWTDKIRSALHFIPGVVITTNVELDPEIGSESISTEIDPKAVPVDVRGTTRTTSSQSAVSSGRPGLAAQGGVNQAAAISSGPGQRNEEETTEEFQRMEVGKRTTEMRKHGLIPRRVTASIGVPSSYFEKIWTERNPPAAGAEAKKPTAADLQTIETEENKKISDYVLQIIPLLPGDLPDQMPLVKVTTFPSITVPLVSGPSLVDTILTWLSQNWGTVGLGLLAVIALLMLRSLARSVPVAEAGNPPAGTIAISAAEEESQPGEGPAPAKPARRLRRRGAAEPTLRDELLEIVREDPDSAANILRRWIGSPN